MKRVIQILPVVILLATGCTTTIGRVQTKLNCQDYANAWCRNAIERGLDAGVLWYYDSVKGHGHAVCWAKDPDSGETVYVEPQTRCVIKNPAERKGVTVTFWSNKPDFNDMDISSRRMLSTFQEGSGF